MIVKCPVCEAMYDCTKGKYQCECGAKFYVSETGETRVADPTASQPSPELSEKTMVFEAGDNAAETSAGEQDILDKTIPPRRHEEYDASADVTIPGARGLNLRIFARRDSTRREAPKSLRAKPGGNPHIENAAVASGGFAPAKR